jgi:HK97 family phage major capsid protein
MSEEMTREQRRERVEELSNRPENREPGANFHEPRFARRDTLADEAREAAQRAIDGAYESERLDEPGGRRLIEIIDREPTGIDARYIAAISDPNYETAFGKKLAGIAGAAEELSSAETEAMLAVGRSMGERALAVGEGKTGGFAVPIAIDPTIMLSSEGAVSPLRELATSTPISTSEWRGVSSAGVTAEFTGEATEAKDASPELSQPVIVPQKAQAFVPYSLEVGEDWTTITAELGKLLRDSKNVLEASKFLTGSGTKEPFGILTGATEEVTSAVEKKVTMVDLYSLQAALPPRFQPNATSQMSLASANFIYKLVGGGSTEPKPFNDARDQLLMKPWRENSVMDYIVETSGKKVVIYGDVAAGFRIIDRIGLSIELIPHLFGKENLRPTGQRGFFAWWRVGSKVVNKNALRVLKIK